MARALASHQCVPGSFPGRGVVCGLSLLLVLILAPRGFLLVVWFSFLHENQQFQIPIRSGIHGIQFQIPIRSGIHLSDLNTTRLLNKSNLFVYLFILILTTLDQNLCSETLTCHSFFVIPILYAPIFTVTDRKKEGIRCD